MGSLVLLKEANLKVLKVNNIARLQFLVKSYKLYESAHLRQGFQNASSHIDIYAQLFKLLLKISIFYNCSCTKMILCFNI